MNIFILNLKYITYQKKTKIRKGKTTWSDRVDFPYLSSFYRENIIDFTTTHRQQFDCNCINTELGLQNINAMHQEERCVNFGNISNAGIVEKGISDNLPRSPYTLIYGK